MAFFEGMFKGNIGMELAVSLGAAVVGPLLAPMISGAPARHDRDQGRLAGC
jgi:hypothetical protein